MNSKSSNDFQWSVSLTSNRNIYTGIVAHFRSHCWIERGDANAIIFDSFDGKIFKGSTVIQKNNIKPQCGDVIHFRFQPKLKKVCNFICKFDQSGISRNFDLDFLERRRIYCRYQRK